MKRLFETGFWKNLKELLRYELDDLIVREAIKSFKLLSRGEKIEDSFYPFPKTLEWVRKCYHRPSETEILLYCFDEILNNHGVEGFQTKKGYCEYSNSGDTYAPTVLFFKGKFRVCDWGTIAEMYGGGE